MEKKKYNRSFASRLSRWVILVLLVMMTGLSFLVYDLMESSVVEVSAASFHSGMRSANGRISEVMSDVSVAVDNQIFDIERHLSEPDRLQDILERIVRQNPRIRSCGISFAENYFPGKGRQYCPYAWRNDSMEVESKQLSGDGYNYLESDWFKQAIASDSAYWSEPFWDGRDAATPLVAYIHPIRNVQGRVVAALGADLSLDFMTRILAEQDSLFEHDAWMISAQQKKIVSHVLLRDGTYMTHPDKRRILKGNFFAHVKDYKESGLAEKAIQEMKDGMTSKDETERTVLVNRKDTYLFYSPVAGTDWILATPCAADNLDFLAMIIGFAALFVITVVVVITFMVCYLTIKRATKPLKLLANTADRVAQGQFDTSLPTIKHRDEICQLRDSFENMQHSLTNYVEELKATTTAKASIENELRIAHNIQMSMLPKTYPAFPDRTDIDIYGLVKPAKAVGGDLYDFFIRDEKLFFCIGDVSGKGVPASLVMAVTRSLFRNIAAHTAEPQQMAKGINESLSDSNDTDMFVTLFVGVLDLTTGLLDYSNAGHDMPMLLTESEVTFLECDPNLPAGVMGGWDFTRQQIQMKAGSTLFLYTDGLNEAENATHQQFGMDRMIQTAEPATRQPEGLVAAMTAAVQQFVGDAEQSDDLTMFAIQKK